MGTVTGGEKVERLAVRVKELVRVANAYCNVIEPREPVYRIDINGRRLNVANIGKAKRSLAPDCGPEPIPRWSGSSVYFIQGVHGGPIKIGFTARDPRKRRKSLQSGSPVVLRLIAAIPGSRELEAALHGQFASSRVYFEWFNPTPELLAVIAELSRC